MHRCPVTTNSISFDHSAQMGYFCNGVEDCIIIDENGVKIDAYPDDECNEVCRMHSKYSSRNCNGVYESDNNFGRIFHNPGFGYSCAYKVNFSIHYDTHTVHDYIPWLGSKCHLSVICLSTWHLEYITVSMFLLDAQMLRLVKSGELTY